MFESNTDFEFDEEIFSQPFEPNESAKSGTAKRTLEGENSETKRPCFDPKETGFPARSSLLLKTLSDGQSKERSQPQPTFSSSVCRYEAKSSASSSPMKKVVLRKFPGPAGLLPERRDLNIDIKALEEMNTKETKQDSVVDMDVICSQMSVKAFHEGPWEKMCNDFRPHDLRATFLPDKYNIAWIKSRAKANKLINQKAPFLAAIIQNIKCLSVKTAIVTMVLKDATGQIHGTIVHDLYEEYIKFLTVGSVVILKQVSVLTMDRGSNHYVTITANNLVRVYSQDSSVADNASDIKRTSPNQNRSNLHDSQISRQEDRSNINLVVVQKFSIDDFLRNISEVRSRHKAAILERKLNPAMDLENILMNLKSANEPSSCSKNNEATRVSFQRTVSLSDNKIAPPSCRSLSMRSTSSNSVNCDWNAPNRTVTLPDSKNTNLVVSAGNNNSFNVCLNKENVDIMSPCPQPKFNFKARLNKSELSPPQVQLITGPKFQTNKCGSEFQPVINNENCNKSTSSVTCSQISITSDNLEHSAILQNVFEGVDADLLFEDF